MSSKVRITQYREGWMASRSSPWTWVDWFDCGWIYYDEGVKSYGFIDTNTVRSMRTLRFNASGVVFSYEWEGK